MLRRALVPLVTAFLLLTAGAVPTAQADARPPVPSQDPFYTPPDPLPGAAGDVLRSRKVDWHPEPFRVFPAPVQTWQVLHRSTSATGEPNAVSGTVLVPPTPWLGKGPRPLVAYAMGTQGLGDQCAPSYHLRSGTEIEIAFLVQAMLKGWAVAVTDYEGLGTPGTHTYAVAQSEGRALLDVARAATRLPETGLTPASPVGAFGYSQGGQAAAAAGELQPAYAPDVKLVGVSEGGVPADLNEVAKFNDGGAAFGLVAGAAVGYSTAYPELPFTDVLNARGKDLVAKVKESCVVELGTAAPFTKLNDLTTKPDIIKDPRWQARLAENRLGDRKPGVPIYLYHGTLDELIPFAGAEKLKARYCALGTRLEWQPVPLAGHIVGVSVWGTNALNWLGDRFDGKPAKTTC
ncbi:lipase family protein [Amycolatopsis anabasis]|uniref:lipase family protein n=1 Tax=Amycolatopsis anabasis TaxID=1840409 RepID=UPI00131D2767|nr:lipase family protein [Amycolatopsis anabasis]